MVIVYVFPNARVTGRICKACAGEEEIWPSQTQDLPDGMDFPLRLLRYNLAINNGLIVLELDVLSGIEGPETRTPVIAARDNDVGIGKNRNRVDARAMEICRWLFRITNSQRWVPKL